MQANHNHGNKKTKLILIFLHFIIILIIAFFWMIKSFKPLPIIILLVVELPIIFFLLRDKKKLYKNQNDEKDFSRDEYEELSRKLNALRNTENRYKNLVQYWNDIIKNVELMFEESNQVKLFSQIQVDFVEESFNKIEHVSNKTKSTKENTEFVRLEIEKIAQYSSKIKENTSDNIQTTYENKVLMQKIISSGEKLQESINIFISKTKEIESVLSHINQIAQKSRTLSINAAIEASKRGVHGAGFSVIAREIRKLADNTTADSKKIKDLLFDIKNSSEMVKDLMGDNQKNVQTGMTNIEKFNNYFRDLNKSFISINDMIQSISDKLNQSIKETLSVFENIKEIKGISKQTLMQSNDFMKVSENLSNLSEQSLNRTLTVPGMTKVSRLSRVMQKARLEIENMIESLIKDKKLTEKELFEPEFIKIPISVDRYDTKYVKVFYDTVKPIMKRYKKIVKGVDNLVMTDLNGYCCLSSGYDAPLTGDPEKDKWNLERILYGVERLEKQTNAVADRDFYVTCYPVKTLKLTISDLSFPIYVFGKRWGTMRVSFRAKDMYND